MLLQRVITALVLLAILLPALLYPAPVVFACAVLVLIAGAAWEWGRLNGCSFAASVGLALVCIAMCAASWQLGWPTQPLALLWTLAGGAWVLGSAWLLRSGVAGWARIPRAVRVVAGVLALWLAWLAASQARIMGVNFLLSVMALVWMADIAAYFSGRTFGLRFTKNKLAPSISPGKSWEGVWGGALGVLLLALLWIFLDSRNAVASLSFYSRLAAPGIWILVLGVLFMTCMSVVGDLVESLVKRSAGAKDSSNLLPGHGGVLDRVDALLPALPIAMMLTRLVS